MENLISSSDYTIQQFDLLFRDKISRDTFIDRVITYSNFLKKPIEKNMFVPCDEFNNILEEPLLIHYTNCNEEQNAKDWLYNLESYNKQKKRVLFYGWDFFTNSLSGAETGVRNEVVFNDNVMYFFNDKPAVFVSSDFLFKTPINTIEDLLKTGLDLKITNNFKIK